MAKKRKIKTRKQRIQQYLIDTKGIPKNDPVERIMHCLGDKLTIDRVKKIIKRKELIESEQRYSCFKITFYEYPLNSERPRTRSFNGMITNYVPNAKDNKKHIASLINDIRTDISIIHTPIYLECNSYHKMPQQVSIEDKVLFEAGILHPVMKPDFDNMIKAYTDMLLEQIILDDDLIYKANIEKFFSFLPRVELRLYYEDKFASKYIYNKIRSRESFKKLSDYIELSEII